MVSTTTRIAIVFTLSTISAFLLAVPTGQGSERHRDDPYDAVRKLQPGISKAAAMRLARSIERVAKSEDCNMPWQLLAAIAYHESSLGVRTVNEATHDYGLMQINKKNVLRYGLSQSRIVKDAEYSIKFACRLLKDNHDRYGNRYPYWLGIYRSGTALWRQEIRANAQRYDHMVRRTAKAIGLNEANAVASR